MDGARALLGALDDLPELPGTVVFFGSIAAVLGNRGQSDYAAANDALETMGAEWSRRTGSRARDRPLGTVGAARVCTAAW